MNPDSAGWRMNTEIFSDKLIFSCLLDTETDEFTWEIYIKRKIEADVIGDLEFFFIEK